jgi:hypothetical protein
MCTRKRGYLFEEEIVGEKVLIELEPNLSSCIETLAKREYEKALSTILKAGTEDEELSERLEVLRLFLESTDFSALRSRYEKYLERQKRLIQDLLRKEVKSTAN